MFRSDRGFDVFFFFYADEANSTDEHSDHGRSHSPVPADNEHEYEYEEDVDEDIDRPLALNLVSKFSIHFGIR